MLIFLRESLFSVLLKLRFVCVYWSVMSFGTLKHVQSVKIF